MLPVEMFRQLLSALTPAMKSRGLRRRRNAYVLQQNGNIAILDIQKSQRSTLDAIVFTINLGIFSMRLADFYDRNKSITLVGITNSHFRERAGDLLGDFEDKWWEISQDKNFSIIKSEILSIAGGIVYSEIRNLIADENLRGRWMSDAFSGTVEAKRLEYLSILINSIGPKRELPGILATLRATARDSRDLALIESHIEDLNKVHGRQISE